MNIVCVTLLCVFLQQIIKLYIITRLSHGRTSKIGIEGTKQLIRNNFAHTIIHFTL